MRAVVISPPEHWLEERRRLGLDHKDEVWDGVLHMVPPPASWHQLVGSALERVLHRHAESRGLQVLREGGVFGPVVGEKDYRVPDVSLVDPKHLSKRGIEARADLVIEILSPDDESRDKFPFFAACKIPEVWLVDPDTRVIEVYVLRGDVYFAVTSDRTGLLHAPALGLDLSVVAGPKLRIAWADGFAEI
jgi:Uma2 family endonuclease